MADDKNWRDKVKSPSEINERMIGGENTLPKDEVGKIDHRKITEEYEKEGKSKQPKFDKEAHAKNIDEAFANKEKQAIKEYENRMTETQPDLDKDSPKKKGSIFNKASRVFDKIEPIVDDALKVLGKGGAKLVPIAGTLYSIFEPESTVDEATEQRQLNEYYEKLQNEQELKQKEDVSAFSAEEKENIMNAMQDNILEERKVETTEPEISEVEKENIMLAMRNLQDEKPIFLKELEPDMNFDPPDFDALSMENDDSDDNGDSSSDGSGDGE